MKQSEIVAGKTYLGRDGSLRHVMDIASSGRPENREDCRVRYQRGKTDEVVSLAAFARWAVEEVKE